jgi:fumarylacetoacetase
MSYGIFSLPGERARVGWRRDGRVLDLSPLGADLAQPSLNALMAAGPHRWLEVHEAARSLEGGIPVEEVTLHLPFAVADYVDFYSSLEHATNANKIFRPGDPLLPNWRHVPIGYHGRAGTVVVSGTDVRRPVGQLGEGQYGPTRRLDVELELGWVVGVPSRPGEPLAPAAFGEHVFGVVLVNDWSARDIQAWESRPLGPFLGKSFATSVSAWVTPLVELETHRVTGPPQEPEPLPYLRHDEPWHLDVELELEVNGEVVTRVNARRLYWSFAQQLAHLTSNGAGIRTGDLCASGTISGFEPGTEGSLLEKGGPFLSDGDEVVLRGRAGDVELGEARGRVLPAP